jgi:ADP-heptose:LPS heptosyltransferase
MALEAYDAPRIVVIRRDNIGDLVCTTPLLAALRERLPRAWIGALVNTYNAEVLARNPAVDTIFAYEKLKHRRGSLIANLMERARIGHRLRAIGLDYVLLPSATPRSLRLAAWLKAKHVLSGTAEGHEVERCFALAKYFGIEGAPGPLRVYPDPQAATDMSARFGRGFTSVHISARRSPRRWPLERYAALVQALKNDRRVMLLWAPGAHDDPRHPGDDAAAEQLIARTGVLGVPTPDLKTLIAVLTLAELVICPDSGAMHIAAALGKPIVALFGESPPERWRPWGVPHRVLWPESRNLANLPLEPVLAAYAELALRPK